MPHRGAISGGMTDEQKRHAVEEFVRGGGVADPNNPFLTPELRALSEQNRTGRSSGGGGGSSVANPFGKTRSEKELEQLARAGILDPEIQKFLPPSLQFEQTGGILDAGIQGIGELIRNPGGLSPNVLDAIRQRLAVESESIAGNFRGIRANQAGGAARSNLPVSIKNALASSLDISEERAQRGARRSALSDSDALRRGDLGQTFGILDAILQFISSGRGHAIAGLSAAAGNQQNRQASNLAFIGQLASTAFGEGGIFNRGKGDDDGGGGGGQDPFGDPFDPFPTEPVVEVDVRGGDSGAR
ncbi:hypothetical protein LCGC14_1100470 [marine sediment metagenome]|uniref:Uncharacterized protein n=1 Tax=marine sediment metagenome TaxID=412755 RepID=A0A0F9ME63_9ZZZZ